jgi:hypothetical protein
MCNRSEHRPLADPLSLPGLNAGVPPGGLVDAPIRAAWSCDQVRLSIRHYPVFGQLTAQRVDQMSALA